MKEHSLGTVAVDLPRNGGGNSSVINEFLRYINVEEYFTGGGCQIRLGPWSINNKKEAHKNALDADLVFKGELYVLASANTFSSAQMFAVTAADNKIGKIIGEIPRNMPASYGDILVFQTLQAKSLFTVS